MIRINIICIGTIKEKYFTAACDEYIKRLTTYCKINIIELPEEKLRDERLASIKSVIEAEGNRIISKLSSGSHRISMCIEGKQLSSLEFADYISNVTTNSTGLFDIIIGGSYGLSEKVKSMCDFKLSMSKMTFTHQMSRMIILEQLYRAFQINSNGKYHK